MKRKISINNVVIASSIITAIGLFVLFDHYRVNSDFKRLKADLMRIRLKSVDKPFVVKFDGTKVSVWEFPNGQLIESQVFSTINKVMYDTTAGKNTIVFHGGTTSMHNKRIHGGEIALKSWFGFRKYIHVNCAGLAEEGQYPETPGEEESTSTFSNDDLFSPAEYIQSKLQAQ